jgi:PTH1 family peptidyl-tRNA hydrolase
MQLLVGLGNPGAQYALHRHNVGFMAMDVIADIHGFGPVQKKFSGWAQEGRIGDAKILLLKPETFMNLSGKSVSALAKFFKIKPEEILVGHDELDVIPGQVKLKFGGSHAGHNGLRDIHAQLGTGDYWRLRLGVGHPGNKDEVVDWVLRKPMQEHRMAIEEGIARSLKAVPALLAGEMAKATMMIHTSTPPRPKPPRKPESDARDWATG